MMYLGPIGYRLFKYNLNSIGVVTANLQIINKYIYFLFDHIIYNDF